MVDFLNVNFRETIPVNFIELFREIIDENVTLDAEKEALINREISLLHCLRNHASFKLDTKNAEDIAGYCNQVNLLLDNFEKLPFDSSIRTKWFNAFSRDDKEEAICVEFVGMRAELVNSLFNYGLALAQEASMMYRDVIPEETNYEAISTLFLKAAGVYEYIIKLKGARKTNGGYNQSADLSSDMLSLIFILMLAEAQSAKYEHMKLKLNNRQSAIILNKSIDYFDIVKKKTLLSTIQPYIQMQWQNAIEIKILRLNSLLCYHSGMDLFLIGNKEGAEELIKMALDKMLIFKENNSLHLVKQDLLLIQQSYADISSPTFEVSNNIIDVNIDLVNVKPILLKFPLPIDNDAIQSAIYIDGEDFYGDYIKENEDVKIAKYKKAIDLSKDLLHEYLKKSKLVDAIEKHQRDMENEINISKIRRNASRKGGSMSVIAKTLLKISKNSDSILKTKTEIKTKTGQFLRKNKVPNEMLADLASIVRDQEVYNQNYEVNKRNINRLYFFKEKNEHLITLLNTHESIFEKNFFEEIGLKGSEYYSLLRKIEPIVYSAQKFIKESIVFKTEISNLSKKLSKDSLNKLGSKRMTSLDCEKLMEKYNLNLVKKLRNIVKTYEDSSMSYIKKLNENEAAFLALFNEIAGCKEELMVNLKLAYDALDHMTPFCDTVSDKCKEVYMDFEELNQRVQTYDTKLLAYLKETRRRRMENRATIIVPNTLFDEDDDSSSTRTLTQTDLDRAVDPEEFSDDDMSIIHEDEIKSLKEHLAEQSALGINESTNYSEKIKRIFNSLNNQ